MRAGTRGGTAALPHGVSSRSTQRVRVASGSIGEQRDPTALLPEEIILLLELLAIPTITPLETGHPAEIKRAQQRFAEYARELGLCIVCHEPPPPAVLEDDFVPEPVRDAYAEMGETFLSCQPNLVLRLGPDRPLERTVAINIHIDTVGGGPAIRQDGERIWGRGAADMKGPAVAVLAAIRQAQAQRGDLASRMSVVVQCVAGEEGGAMGVHGTRVLLEAGHRGALMIFAEPSNGWFLDRSPATMTAAVEVRGEGSTDDAPAAGHNATLLLSHLGCRLAVELDRAARSLGGAVCVGGLTTGTRHDRVYGCGRLLLNIAYPNPTAGSQLGEFAEIAFAEARQSFSHDFATVGIARRTAADAARICQMRWLKRGLPALENRDPQWEAVLAAAGLRRAGEDRREQAITCDAIWGAHPGTYTIVFGPGDLARNGAHTDREHIDLHDLADYSRALAQVLLAFDDHCIAREIGRAA
jgi:acetylornithine deacetylase/succinyl-diaminopimelate desuccinylase-like protein